MTYSKSHRLRLVKASVNPELKFFFNSNKANEEVL